jgi:hypothetical protein
MSRNHSGTSSPAGVARSGSPKPVGCWPRPRGGLLTVVEPADYGASSRMQIDIGGFVGRVTVSSAR